MQADISTPHVNSIPSSYAHNVDQHGFYPNAVPQLQGDKVLLHAYSEAELDCLIPLLQDENTNRWFMTALQSADDCRTDLLNTIHGYTNPNPSTVHLEWCIYRASDQQPMGFIYLEWNKGGIYEAEVGYLLASPYWKHGYATQALQLVRDFAFDEFGIGKLTARCAWNNVASISVLTKAGFSHERVARQEAILQGKQVDAYIMGMTRNSYAALQLHQQRQVPVSCTGLVAPASHHAQQVLDYIKATPTKPYVSERIHHLGTRELETDRLYLRPVGVQHAAEAFTNWLSDPQVTRFITFPTYTSVAEAEQRFASFAKSYANPDFYFWGIFSKEDNALMGTISISIRSDSFLDIGVPGYCLGRKFWSKGYATEAMHEVLRFAFCEIGLKLLQICHVTANSASANVIRKTGFTFAGMQLAKPHVVFGPQDVMCYDMLATDYFASHPELSPPALPIRSK